MLQRIESIKNVGLFRDVAAARHTFRKATLFYADNGRGKSTWAAIFRSVASGDNSLIAARRTIDSPDAPEVVFQIGSGHKVKFERGAWSEPRKEFLVFDNDFADRNVHSGGVVNTNHRKNLLEFALGEKAVAMRKTVDDTTAAVSKATAEVKQHTTALSGFHDGITVAAFEALKESETIDEEIEAQTKKVVAASNVEAILKKPLPAELTSPSFDIAALFLILGSSLEDIHADAERLVKEHTAKVGVDGLEGWLSEGRQFEKTEECPYCGQSTAGLELIAAYRSHFNKAYADLKAKVAALAVGIERRAGDAVVEEIARSVSTANQVILGWAEHKKIAAFEFKSAEAKALLKEIRELLEPLARKKVASPPEAVADADIQEQVAELWLQFLALVADANKSIVAARATIEEFRKSLAAANVLTEKSALRTLQLRKSRYSEEVVKLFRQRKIASDKVTELEAKKTAARKELNTLMEQVLGKYQTEINTILVKFGASFTIESLNANYRGAAPRSEYALRLRGKSVAIDGDNLAFATALSEGDKRTLAFAFFVASAFQDPQLARKIVVIDDPMCSFDLNRKSQTQLVLRRLFGESLQLVVLAHDVYFLKELHATLEKEGSNDLACFQVKYAANGYSDFDTMDFYEACEGKYYKNHRHLTLFANGDASADPHKAAKAIRPFLEGYLHRRFPGHVPTELVFGQVIAFIKSADATHPVAAAKVLVDCLGEINEYAGKFHHDTNDGLAERVVVVESELRPYVERALKVAYTGAAA